MHQGIPVQASLHRADARKSVQALFGSSQNDLICTAGIDTLLER
ncbi:MAG: hypothetical protein H6R21_1606 [Proteobacteria bacterium]|nr:hypothetical protein [Pseudomonadota bacterium]